MAKHSELDVRMKTYYEEIPKTKLMRRCPVVVRLDGAHHHSFTRGMNKPFDEVYMTSMQRTMQHLCENIQGCVIGYTQSDEITLVLIDYKNLNSSAWFDYEVQKMCSVAASEATFAFNKFFREEMRAWWNRILDKNEGTGVAYTEEEDRLLDVYAKCLDKGAKFDARVFNLPKEEVANMIYWRQQDAIRNSIQALGQAHFSSKQLENKSTSVIKQMLIDEKGINWNELPIHKQRGSCCVKMPFVFNEGTDAEFTRNKWFIDKGIPIFKDENRAYINDLIYI